MSQVTKYTNKSFFSTLNSSYECLITWSRRKSWGGWPAGRRTRGRRSRGTSRAAAAASSVWTQTFRLLIFDLMWNTLQYVSRKEANCDLSWKIFLVRTFTCAGFYLSARCHWLYCDTPTHCRRLSRGVNKISISGTGLEWWEKDAHFQHF